MPIHVYIPFILDLTIYICVRAAMLRKESLLNTRPYIFMFLINKLLHNIPTTI